MEIQTLNCEEVDLPVIPEQEELCSEGLIQVGDKPPVPVKILSDSEPPAFTKSFFKQEESNSNKPSPLESFKQLKSSCDDSQKMVTLKPVVLTQKTVVDCTKQTTQELLPPGSAKTQELKNRLLSSPLPSEVPSKQRSQAMRSSPVPVFFHPMVNQSMTKASEPQAYSSKKEKKKKEDKQSTDAKTCLKTQTESDSNPDQDQQHRFYQELDLETQEFFHSMAQDLESNRTNKLQFLRLFFEIMKLYLQNDHISKSQRQVERQLQVEHMLNIVKSWKDQKQSLKITTFLSGAMGIAGGALPIFGQFSPGIKLHDLATRAAMFKQMEPEKFYDSISKVCSSLAESTRMYSQGEVAEQESIRVKDQTLGEIHRTDHEENTRRIQEFIDEFNKIAQFLQQMLQMEYDASSKLHS